MSQVSEAVERAREGWEAPLRARIAELEAVISGTIFHLERDYDGLPKDKYPGPPTSIIEKLRAALREATA